MNETPSDTAAVLRTVHCLWCGKDTGMPQMNPWLVPAGCNASLIVSCPACMAERRPEQWHGLRAGGRVERPDGEPPADPLDGEVSQVIVMRHRGAYAAIAISNGEVLGRTLGWTTKSAAFDHGARVITDTEASSTPRRTTEIER